jgi:hypothetical protein
MALKDLRAALDGTLKLPIGGTTYEVAPISAELGLQFQDLMAIAAKAKENPDYSPDDDDAEVLNDAGERGLYERALGPAHDQMIEGGVTFAELKLAALYVIFHAVYGDTFADAYWASGGKAPAPNRAARRTATRTRTGAATTTKPRASRSTTTTPKGTRKPAA